MNTKRQEFIVDCSGVSTNLILREEKVDLIRHVVFSKNKYTRNPFPGDTFSGYLCHRFPDVSSTGSENFLIYIQNSAILRIQAKSDLFAIFRLAISINETRFKIKINTQNFSKCNLE